MLYHHDVVNSVVAIAAFGGCTEISIDYKKKLTLERGL